jgi:hypothetical protein
VTNNEKGTVAAAIDAVSNAVHALPPAFVVLALMNAIFLGALFFYLLEQQSDRTQLLKQVLDSCVVKQ